MTLPDPPVLAFDDITLDLAGHRLLRAGQPQPLEPKAFAVLCLLARAPGQVFSREEILDAVWGHRHVTPGVLNRIITLLRHALGEDAQHPRYLHTVYGYGYRFDRPGPQQPTAAGIRVPADTGPSDGVPATPAHPLRRAGDQDEGARATPVRYPGEGGNGATEGAGTLAAPPQAPDRPHEDARATSPSASREGGNGATEGTGTLAVPSPAVDRAHDGTRATPPRARSTPWRWSALAVLVLAAVVVGGHWIASREPAPQAAQPTAGAPVLAVLPLRALGDDPRGQAFADGLSEELTGLLAHLDGLRVISRTSSFRFRDAGLPLPEVARQLQASHLLEGSVRQDGERLRINLRLIEAANDRTVWAQDYDRELRDIFVLQRNIAYAIGNALQLQLGLTPNTARADEDPALYRRYLLARFGQRNHKRDVALLESERELRELLHEHPGYARAWGGLSAILAQRAVAPFPGRDTLRRQAEQAAAQALKLDPDQADAHAVLADRACRLQRWSDCMALSRRAIALAPSDPIFRGMHAYRLATMGYVDDAQREIDAALAIAPFDPIVHFWRGRILDTLGRHDEAQRHLLLADPGLAATALFFNAVWRGDHDDAQRIADGLPADMPWRASELAAVAAMRDPARWAEVLPKIQAAERNPRYGQVPYDFTRLLLPQRDHARDIAGLDAVQRAGYASYQWVFWQPESQALRRDPAFARYLRDSGLLAYWREHGWPARCRADGDGARCD